MDLETRQHDRERLPSKDETREIVGSGDLIGRLYRRNWRVASASVMMEQMSGTRWKREESVVV